MYTPIMTDIEAGPPDLLKVIHWGCKGPCGNSCSCRKAGLNCASTYKECHGITCNNAPVIEPKVEEDEYERNFLGISDKFNVIFDKIYFILKWTYLY